MATPARPVRPAFVVTAVALTCLIGAAAIVLVRGQASAAPAVTIGSHPVTQPPSLAGLGPTHSVKEIMAGVVDPAADGIWNSLGAVTTADRDESWAPSTTEDWRRLEGHARVLARAADVLVEPARVNSRPGWIEPARGLRAAADRALLAAQRRDVDGLAAASEGLLDACQQCHKTYWLPTAVSP
jgi:hypothetical protein